VLKQGRFGEFTACTNYPECKYVKHKTTGVKCPKDADKGGEVVERKSKRGKGVLRLFELSGLRLRAVEPADPEPCPKCGAPFLVEKITKKHGRQLLCNNEDCDYSRSEDLPRRRDHHHRRRTGRVARPRGRRRRSVRGPPVRNAAGCGRRRFTRPIASPSSSAAIPFAATSWITPSAC
jgi:hypothetical protein